MKEFYINTKLSSISKVLFSIILSVIPCCIISIYKSSFIISEIDIIKLLFTNAQYIEILIIFINIIFILLLSTMLLKIPKLLKQIYIINTFNHKEIIILFTLITMNHLILSYLHLSLYIILIILIDIIIFRIFIDSSAIYMIKQNDKIKYIVLPNKDSYKYNAHIENSQNTSVKIRYLINFTHRLSKYIPSYPIQILIIILAFILDAIIFIFINIIVDFIISEISKNHKNDIRIPYGFNIFTKIYDFFSNPYTIYITIEIYHHKQLTEKTKIMQSTGDIEQVIRESINELSETRYLNNPNINKCIDLIKSDKYI
jgi:hypothetical protein